MAGSRRIRLIALGAALSYFFDPQNGNRRRKLAVDRTAGFVRRRGRETARTGRAVAAEAFGISQKVRLFGKRL